MEVRTSTSIILLKACYYPTLSNTRPFSSERVGSGHNNKTDNNNHRNLSLHILSVVASSLQGQTGLESVVVSHLQLVAPINEIFAKF